MKNLSLGGRVRVTTPAERLNCRIGKIIHITEPFVANEQMKSQALQQLPLYDIELEDGSHERCRGRDLEPAG